MYTLFRLENRSVVQLQGEGVQPLLKKLLCGDVRALEKKSTLFSPMLNMQGGTMDNVLAILQGDTCWLAVHEQSREKDLHHMKAQAQDDVKLLDRSADLCLYTLMGPQAEALLRNAPVFWQMPSEHMGEDCWLLCVERGDVEALETEMARHGVVLCSQGELNTLMIEKGVPAYGRELDDTINPLEAGLARYVHLERPGFVGREALVAAGDPRRGVIGLTVETAGAARGMNVVHRDKDVGMVTSACYSPRLKAHIALALVEKPYQDVGRMLKVECGETLLQAQVSALPFEAGEAPDDSE